VLAVSTLLAACDRPAPAPPPANVWQPAAGTCHDGFTFSLSQAAYEELSCTEPHLYEAFHVGTFAASVGEPPAAGSKEFKDTWAFCDGLLSEYVGGDWRDRQLRLRVAAPKPAAWQSGARWFLCTATVWTLNGAIVRLTKSMKDGFATMPELEYGCIELIEHPPASYARRCDEPHNTEYVGHFSADEGDPKTSCATAVDGFTGTKGVYGEWLAPAFSEEWEIGDHDVRCFVYSDRYISKSLKAPSS
jgi:hypothetical protein